MKEFLIKAWKEPVFYASVDIEAETLEQALEMAKAHDWEDEPFEDCAGEWPPVCWVAAEDTETSTVLECDFTPPVELHASEIFDALKLAFSMVPDMRPRDPDFFNRERIRALIVKVEGKSNG